MVVMWLLLSCFKIKILVTSDSGNFWNIFFPLLNEKIPDKRMKKSFEFFSERNFFSKRVKMKQNFYTSLHLPSDKRGNVKEISFKWKAWITFLISIHSFRCVLGFEKCFNLIVEVLSMNFAWWNSHSYHFVWLFRTYIVIHG